MQKIKIYLNNTTVLFLFNIKLNTTKYSHTKLAKDNIEKGNLPSFSKKYL